MKKLLIVFVLFLCAVASIPPLSAQNNTTRFFFAYDYENITIDNTAGGKGFTASKIRNSSNSVETAQLVTFTIYCASGTDCPIRFTLDGTAPTTSVGMRAIYGQSVSIYALVNIEAFRAIREGATSAVINVTYFR